MFTRRRTRGALGIARGDFINSNATVSRFADENFRPDAPAFRFRIYPLPSARPTSAAVCRGPANFSWVNTARISPLSIFPSRAWCSFAFSFKSLNICVCVCVSKEKAVDRFCVVPGDYYSGGRERERDRVSRTECEVPAQRLELYARWN